MCYDGIFIISTQFIQVHDWRKLPLRALEDWFFLRHCCKRHQNVFGNCHGYWWSSLHSHCSHNSFDFALLAVLRPLHNHHSHNLLADTLLLLHNRHIRSQYSPSSDSSSLLRAASSGPGCPGPPSAPPASRTGLGSPGRRLLGSGLRTPGWGGSCQHRELHVRLQPSSKEETSL